ncbi:MAG: LiaF domain-containing protein, partial [Actinomycetota bacterium]
ALLGGAFWLAGALRVRYPVLPIVAVLAALGVLGYTLLRSRRVAAVVAAMALLLVPTALVAAVTRVDGQAGDRSITPRVASDLDREYRHAIGVLSLDLSALQLPPGPTPLEISMGAGQVEVTVPWDAEVEARASVSAGSFDLFGNRQTGVNLDGKSRSSGQPGAPVLVITAKAGAGEIIVRRGYEPFTHQALRTGQPVPVSCYPDGPPAVAAAASSTMHCSAADGVTKIPALACVVSDSGSALCRPAGEPEPVVDFTDDPGTRRCQVPAGGGRSLCTAPNPGTRSEIGGQGSFTCTIPAGGGPAVCHPAGSGSGPPPPAPPADPNAPGSTTPATPVPPAPPGEYRCTVPDGGGPATCEPI